MLLSLAYSHEMKNLSDLEIWRYTLLLLVTAGAAMMLAELAMKAGLPKGVLNIVHGTHVWYT